MTKKKQKQYLVKVWFFVDTTMDKQKLREKTMLKWGALLGDALENVEVIDFGDDDGMLVVTEVDERLRKAKEQLRKMVVAGDES